MVWGPNGPKRIDSIEPGDLIYSYNPKLGVIEIVPVLERYENGERDCVRVVSKTGHSSIATTDHNYFTTNGEVEAASLTTNDILLEINEPEHYGPDTNESEAILLGYLLTDGYYGKQIHFTNTCWKYLLDFQKHFQLRFGFRRKIVPHSRDNAGKITSYRIYMTGDESKQWVINLGIYKQVKEQKVIPEQVFRWNNKSISLLLNRMFAGDGWYSGTHCNEAGLCSESIVTLNQVKQLLSRFGINSKVYPATKRGMPKLRIFGSTSFARFVEHIGIFGKTPRLPLTKGFFFNRRKGAVKSIQPVGPQKVYDLRVPPFDNYIVDGVVVHNSGISTISGAFALWFGMFHSNKNILIVSRKNDDAMAFLRQNIMFQFRHLPQWMQDAWEPVKENEHAVIFPNGSKIQSLTSHPEVLRSHSSSLNIIDEAAFIQGMDVMWAAGWPTLQHGGSVICVSTSNGVGNWYWNTWVDAEAGLNGWNPIMVNWWDMDWAIEYTDALSLQHKRIAPLDGVRDCTTKEEIEKYGPKWSPWLEEQYRALQEQGESWKFDQEILAAFVGSGNTVLPKNVLSHLRTTIVEPIEKIKGNRVWINAASGESEELNFDFPTADEGLWIWEAPVLATPDKRRGNIVTEYGKPAHAYVMGVDISTGKGRDYCTIEVFDVDTREQVAELMCRCLPRTLVKYIDLIGRWYNCALAVVERNNGGDILIDELRYTTMYPRLWRRKGINDKPRPTKAKMKARAMHVEKYGFATSASSKQTLNKFLLDFIRDNDSDGYRIYSKRLVKQLETYVRKRDKSGRDTDKTEAEEGVGNFDDLVMATGMALIGTQDIFNTDAGNMIPMGGNTDFRSQTGPTVLTDATRIHTQEQFIDLGGASLLFPMALTPDELPETSAQRVIDKFTLELGAIPINQGKPIVTPPKYYFERK